MRSNMLAATLVTFAIASPVGAARKADRRGPTITDITTSNHILVISDCLSTSVTISARVTDQTGIENVLLWSRAGSTRRFKSATMSKRHGRFEKILKGKELRGQGYGSVEFYITAQDDHGNSTASPPDRSIQFLPCVQN